jgi:hypothetical protein
VFQVSQTSDQIAQSTRGKVQKELRALFSQRSVEMASLKDQAGKLLACS